MKLTSYTSPPKVMIQERAKADTQLMKIQTCASTTRVIVNPCTVSMYSIRSIAISTAKVKKIVGTLGCFERKL